MAEVPNSILDTTKKLLGLAPEYDVFDVDIIIHINSVFATLHQLGIGTEEPYEIEDNQQLWTDFLGDNKLANSVKTLMYLKVKLWFDSSSSTSFDLTAKQEQIKELEWRLNAASDKGYKEMPLVTDDREE